MSKIAIIGTGYVGLVSGCCLAEAGNEVIAVDVDKEKIEKLSKGEPTIFEPGLEELLNKNIKNGRLSFSVSVRDAIKDADACFIAVGTPHDKTKNEPDLNFVFGALNEILENVSGDLLIVNKSTVPLGTADNMMKIIQSKKLQYQVSLCSNPEFLAQGSAVKDFMEPHRILIGVEDKNSEKILKEIYKYFIDKGYKFISTNIASAELAKYAANSLLALKVAYINEIASFSEKIDAKIADVKDVLTTDPRIGDKFLNPGPGYGGSCFPKDTRALAHAGNLREIDLPIISNIDASNEARISFITRKVEVEIEKRNAKNITILGLAFKAGTDDVRDSQGIKIIKYLNKTHPSLGIKAYDPEAKFTQDFDAEICDNLNDAIENSDLVCVVTAWPEFKKLSLDNILDLSA
jgi:UDPglucose 6-dehydrogenase